MERKTNCSLRQDKNGVDGACGGGGRVGIPREHVLRAWHHSAVQLSWSHVVQCIAKSLHFLKGKMSFFAILRPLASLRRLLRGHTCTALRMNSIAATAE